MFRWPYGPFSRNDFLPSLQDCLGHHQMTKSEHIHVEDNWTEILAAP